METERDFGSPAILVTGGSGFVGSHVVQELGRRNESVVSMYYRRLPEPMANVYPVCSDMGSSELLAAPLRGVDTVVHLAWENNLVGPLEDVSWDLSSTEVPPNIRLLRNLISAMERAGTRRIIFLSAIGTSRFTTTPFLKEKYMAEVLVLNSRIPEKVVVRSSVICGGVSDSDRFIRSIMRLMKVPGLYPVPRTETKLSPLNIRDVARILADLCRFELQDPTALIELDGGETYAIGEVFRMVSDRYLKGNKLAIGGFLGNSLMPFFERDSKGEIHTPRLRHFLALSQEQKGGAADKRPENPLAPIIPKKLCSFRETLAKES